LAWQNFVIAILWFVISFCDETITNFVISFVICDLAVERILCKSNSKTGKFSWITKKGPFD
jgi:hypothetical protein